MKDLSYTFDLPFHHKSIIRVIGVGGGGSNAVNNMYKRGIKDVSFIVCNTDVQALRNSPIQHKLQIGAALTSGLGAGANPEVGRNAALESKENIRELLNEDTKMLFITAGMGGGTGTGAAPVIAGIAQKQGILTVGIVTLPFSFEGKKKYLQAQEGISEMRKYCDTVLIILNDKIQTTLGGLSITQAFLEADKVLTTAAKSIAEIITVPGYVNVDFEDVKTVMKNAGAAVMGSGEAEGEDRALQAAEAALASPLLDYTDIRGAKKILLSIVSGQAAELQMDELTVITNYIQAQTGDDAEVIFGHGADPEMAEKLKVTVIATGFKRSQTTAPAVGATGTQQTLPPEPILQDTLTQPEEIYSSPTQTIGIQEETTPRTAKKKEQEGRITEESSVAYPPNWNHALTRKPLNKQRTTAQNWEDRYVKEQLEIPAYLRKYIKLDLLNLDSSVAKEEMRYWLNDPLDKPVAKEEEE
ncbi:MAG: cell division protein FtsZ [Candidatus Cardinium sp.]|nr:cell division protein FtsZ [Candidatus Cardinium sp.]